MKHKVAKTPSFTYGALDTVQVIQMGKYLDTIYVSGWQSSSTASTSNEPGPDLADYPMVRFYAFEKFMSFCEFK
jgi:isocitrate lyase